MPALLTRMSGARPRSISEAAVASTESAWVMSSGMRDDRLIVPGRDVGAIERDDARARVGEHLDDAGADAGGAAGDPGGLPGEVDRDGHGVSNSLPRAGGRRSVPAGRVGASARIPPQARQRPSPSSVRQARPSLTDLFASLPTSARRRTGSASRGRTPAACLRPRGPRTGRSSRRRTAPPERSPQPGREERRTTNSGSESTISGIPMVWQNLFTGC